MKEGIHLGEEYSFSISILKCSCAAFLFSFIVAVRIFSGLHAVVDTMNLFFTRSRLFSDALLLAYSICSLRRPRSYGLWHISS